MSIADQSPLRFLSHIPQACVLSGGSVATSVIAMGNNLTVADAHTYVVGGSGWVNRCFSQF